MKIESLYIYPLKSTKGIALQEVDVMNIGFKNDRYFGVINSMNEIITARENPELLKIKTEIDDDTIKIIYKNQSETIRLNNPFDGINASLFKKQISGKSIHHNEINLWLSKVLNSDSRLVKIDFDRLRENNNTKITFSDSYPIHLINLESVTALNQKLEVPVKENRFRPNIIVSGIKAFEEENWTKINIGECEFKVVCKTERCTLITINTETGEKSKNQEPLRTLAKEFSIDKKVKFGIYLIPTKMGLIKTTDCITVKETNKNNNASVS